MSQYMKTRSFRHRLNFQALEDRTVPATFFVSNNMDGLVPGSLRQAVADANNAPNSPAGTNDIIQFTAATAGTTVTLDGVTGEMAITEAVTIIGPALVANAPDVTIDGAAFSRHFNVATAAGVDTVSFSGLRMINAKAAGSGGSILMSSVEDTFNYTDMVFDSNVGANSGGAIGSAEPAVAVYGTINITRNTFTNNSNTVNFGGALGLAQLLSGAGITKGWTTNILDTTFDSNKNDRNGGALFLRGYAQTLNVTNTTFSNNMLTSDGFGGNISILSGAGAQSSKLTFTNTTFSGNSNNDVAVGPTSGAGGAGGVLGNGGGATPTILFQNCTLVNNFASFAGGVIGASSGNPNITFESSIIFGNTSGFIGQPSTFFGGTITAKNSIIEDKSGALAFVDGGGNLFGATANPMLLPLAFNAGGKTQTHLPSDGSTAREAGLPGSTVTVDANGVVRPVGTFVDLGSVESIVDTPIAHTSGLTNILTVGGTDYSFDVTYFDGVAINKATIGTGEIIVSGPLGDITATVKGALPGASVSPLTVTYQFTPPGGTWDGGDNGVYSVKVAAATVADTSGKFVPTGTIGGATFNVSVPKSYIVNTLVDTAAGAGDSGSLRYVLNAANAFLNTNDSITFNPGLSGTIKLSLGELLISEAVNLIGPGGGKIVVSGDNLSRVFNIVGTGSFAVNASGFTVSGGNAAGDGGAFAVTDETLNLTNMIVSGNTASGDGGAVVLASSGGKLNATNSTFSTNSAGLGGGVVATNANALVTLVGCTLELNTAATGGAIDVNLGNLNISNSLFANNSATGNGGAVRLTSTLGTLIFSNTTFSGNTAGGTGGAISTDHAAGTLQIRNSTIAANSATGNGGGIFHSGGNAQPGDISIVSSIVAGNFSSTTDLEVTSVTATFSSSVIGGNGGGGIFVDGGGNFLGVDPVLGPLANNGGLTRTMGLLPGSPALNAGTNPDALGFDQRGTPFVRTLDPLGNPGGVTDIGAFEGQLPVPGGVLTPLGPITVAAATPNQVVVTFADETGILGTSINNDEITITAPDNVTLLTITGFSDANPGNGKVHVVTYTFTVPGGAWDVTDNGTYTVRLLAGKVTDTDPSPNTNPALTLGLFKVAVPISYLVDEVSDVDDAITTVGKLSLREAIGLANLDGIPSVINFSTVKFATPQTITMAAGEMAITSAVAINGPTAKLTINANVLSRHFNIDDTVNVGAAIQINGLTLTNGSTVGVNGGSVLVNGDESVTFTNVTISNSTTDSDGGGVFGFTNSTLRFVNSTVSNNSATGAASQGGGINLGTGGNLMIEGSTVSGNIAAGDGGGFYFLNGGSLLVSRSTISGNKADTVFAGFGGGGGYFFGAANAKGVVISNSTFSGNSANNSLGGGALMFQQGSGSLVVENSTFSGNTANNGAGGGYGGAILTNASAFATLVIRNSTIANNDAGKFGGGLALTQAAATINSTIIAKNTVGGVGTVAGSDLFSLGTVVTGDNNLVGINDATTKMTFAGTNPLIGTTGAPIDAKLDVLALNGAPAGSPFTLALLPGSQAINAGNNLAALSFDQRGTGFNRSAGVTDIGAFEVQTSSAKVVSVTVNGGAAQRSRVTFVTVTFDSIVTLPGAPETAFTLTRISDSATVTLSAAVNNTGPGTVVTLTFTGGAVDFGSLADGRYTLTIVAANVNGGGLDGDGNGTSGDDFVLVGNTTTAPRLYRYYGDSDGDGDVDVTDFTAFRLAFGAGPSAIFDGDNDGDVDVTDFGKFRSHFGGTVP